MNEDLQKMLADLFSDEPMETTAPLGLECLQRFMLHQPADGPAESSSSVNDLSIATQDAISGAASRASGVALLLGQMFYGEIEERFRPELQSLTWSLSAICQMLIECRVALDGDPAASSPVAAALREQLNQTVGLAELVRGVFADESSNGATSSRFSDEILANALHALCVEIEKLRDAIDGADPTPVLQ